FDSMLSRTLVAARTKLMRTTLDVANQIRGLMKTFGLIVPCGMGGQVEVHVRSLLADNAGLSRIILPLLEAWLSLRFLAAKLELHLLADARRCQQCLLLMSIPGVGAITAAAYLPAVEYPANLMRSLSVGAWLGSTTRLYQSGVV